jgi:hypothetical protein
MKLQNQVVSLELAKKLKELGFPQDSLFYWTKSLDGKNVLKEWRIITGDEEINAYGSSAYTVAELGEMLPGLWMPVKDEENGRKPWLRVDREINKTWEETEADARAKTLIYLKENKLI